jgi:hypothetical protein
MKEPHQAVLQSVSILRFALPYGEYAPSGIFELCDHGRIPASVTFDLWAPKFDSAFGKATLCASMPMPKTSVHQDRHTVLSQDQVGFSGQTASMQAKPQP